MQPRTYLTKMQTRHERADHRMLQRAARIGPWWRGLPLPKPAYFRPRELELALNVPITVLARPLRVLGWRSIVRSFDGMQQTVWLPPGSPIQKRPPGRPRIYEPDAREVLTVE